jgi:hypothetical protein
MKNCEEKNNINNNSSNTANNNHNTHNDHPVIDIAVGFHTQGSYSWHDAQKLEMILPYWKANDIRVVVLERRNTLARSLASSGRLKTKTNESSTTTTTLSEDMLRDLSKKTDSIHQKFQHLVSQVKNAGLDLHYVTYESLLQDPATHVAALYNFILRQDGKLWETFHVDATTQNGAGDGVYNKEVEEEKDEDVGNDVTVIYDPVLNYTREISSESRHHKKAMKDRISNFNQSMALLQDIYPQGVCMLTEDCEWFYDDDL